MRRHRAAAIAYSRALFQCRPPRHRTLRENSVGKYGATQKHEPLPAGSCHHRKQIAEPPRKPPRQTSLRLPFVQRTKERLTTGWILLRRGRKSPPLQWPTIPPPRTLVRTAFRKNDFIAAGWYFGTVQTRLDANPQDSVDE
jgi:hypothetical protein